MLRHEGTVPEIDRHRYRIECSNRIMFKQ